MKSEVGLFQVEGVLDAYDTVKSIQALGGTQCLCRRTRSKKVSVVIIILL